jgi:hypothetical protein
MLEVIMYEIANIQPPTALAGVHCLERDRELGVGGGESSSAVRRVASQGMTPAGAGAAILTSRRERRVGAIDFDQISDYLSGDPRVARQDARRAVECSEERGSTLANGGLLRRGWLVIGLVATPIAVSSDPNLTRVAGPESDRKAIPSERLELDLRGSCAAQNPLRVSRWSRLDQRRVLP